MASMLGSWSYSIYKYIVPRTLATQSGGQDPGQCAPRSQARRIISMRKANEREQARYKAYLE
jgi:hypothetical protein